MSWTIAMFLAATLLQDEGELGQKAYQEGRFAEAADHFEKAVAKDKKSPQLWIALGHASLQANRWEAAIRAYREAIALKVDTADLHRALARAFEMGGREDEAMGSLRRAVALDPEGTDSLSIARILVKREAWLLAEQELLQYLRRSPSSIEGLEVLAYILGRSGRIAEAGEVYRDLERRRPAEMKYRIAAARLAASQSHYGEAIDALELVRHLGELKDEDERLLADLYLQERMYPEAAACYARRLALLNPPKAEDAYRLGHAYYESKEFASAQEAFRKVLAIDPTHGGASLHLGHIAQAQGNADEARRCFTEAEKRMADSPQPAIALGNLELKESAWVQAAEAFRRAVHLGSADPAIWYNLVFSWHQAGRHDEERQALKEALREAP
ncbi:MAG TPA: tetratricopeptide repeat protein, partial [Planctomycetota bacterium]|nr:tetratricopeptide repeat protein [Planctomycetota bacterium]